VKTLNLLDEKVINTNDWDLGKSSLAHMYIPTTFFCAPGTDERSFPSDAGYFFPPPIMAF
jgi:hypothetical protein